MDHQKEIFPASSSQQIKERKDDRHRSDWQTLVIVTKLGGLVLSLLFHYVKVTQTDYRSYTIQAENDHTRNMVHSQTITDHCRKHTKTYHITIEENRQDKFLRHLYNDWGGRLCLKIIIQPFVTRLGGWFLNTRLSARMIPGFVERNHIDLSSCPSLSLRVKKSL